MQRIALLGCGNIAGIIADHREGLVDIVACHDIDRSRMATLAKSSGARPCEDIADLLACDVPLLVEAASVDAVREHLPAALAAGKEVVVLSVGAFTDQDFLARVRQAAAGAGRRVYIPSGAIFGLDNFKAAGIPGLDHLRLKTTKPPRALGMDKDAGRQRLYAGPASGAVELYPKNVNVCAALGLAAGREPEVELWADPGIETNRHEIEASGAFGSVSIRMDNLPSPENPATSYLAALSVLALLKRLGDPICVGT